MILWELMKDRQNPSLMALKSMLTQSDLTAALREFGLDSPCRLMVHASLSSLGFIEGGAVAVVAALRELAGNGGAVIIPSFKGSIRSEHYGMRECRSVCPQELCPSRERGETGIVGETLREQPDAIRSCHPTHSWVGVGSARQLLEGHRHSPTPCGNDSPFLRLMECGGVVLLIGVGVEALTNIHVVEEARNLPYLSATDASRRHATYTTSGRRLQYQYPALLQEALQHTGLLRSRKTGAGISHVISARDLGAWLWVVTEDDPWCLVLRPRGNEYEPFQDACRKVAGMDGSWKKNPDREAWKLLLESSRRSQEPVRFEPAQAPATGCPAYRGVARNHHRCAANDVPPWEKFEDYPPLEPGVATCRQCNWPAGRNLS